MIKSKLDHMTNTDNTSINEAELKWGGIAGLIGSVLLGVVYTTGQIDLLRSIFMSSIFSGFIRNGLILLAYLLWVPFFLVLFRVLRRHRPALTLFAVSFAVVGMAILASVSHQGLTMSFRVDHFIPLLSNIEITESKREMLVLVEMAINGTYLASISVAYIASMAGILFFGVAILGSPDFGRRVGWTGIVLGCIGLISSLWLYVDQESPGGLPAVIVLIIFNALVGWRLFSTRNQKVVE